MSPIELFTSWLLTVPTIDDFEVRLGHWTTFENSHSNQYVAFSVVGGAAPRELNTRFPHIMVTMVAAVHDELTAISTLAENIMLKAEQIPRQCVIVGVNAMGEPLGPMQTGSGRPLLTVTLEMIIDRGK